MKISKMRFRNYGGSCQAVIETAGDLVKASKLDAAHWAITSIDKSNLVCSGEFLDFLDGDGDGRIRTDEVRGALLWLLKVLKSPESIVEASDKVSVAMLNSDDEEGKLLAGTVERVLSSLGMPRDTSVTPDDLADHAKILADALHNGDGIIPPELLTDEKLSSLVRDVMKHVCQKQDLGGLPGADLSAIEKYEEMMKVHAAVADELSNDKGAILPFGSETEKLYASFSEIKEAIDGFFMACGTAAFTGTDLKVSCEASSIDGVRDFLGKSPISTPSPDFVLRTGKNVNPLWQKRLETFVNDAKTAAKLDFSEKLSLEDWRKLSGTLAPYGTWLEKEKSDPLSDVDASVTKQQLADDLCGKLKKIISEDADCGIFIKEIANLKKLAVLKKYMLKFLNNFISTSMLFDTECGSMLQAGCLIMGGRRFTLCTFIKDVEAHKKIAKLSDICIMYLEAETGCGKDKKKRLVAAAVTSGNIRDVFVGKYGIFVSEDGTVWDARVVDLIEQPVSVPEAVKMPFHRFAEILQKQADKFFGAKSKAFEDSAAKDFQTGANTVMPPAGAQASQQAKPQTPAFSGAMVLMGGGVGIAAIGSAFAFMAKTLQGISVGLVLAVFLGILLIFGGPIVISSLIKLFHRNLGLFLEANGTAMNRKMLLTLKLGNFFTYTPKLPKRTVLAAIKKIVIDSDENDEIKRRKVFRNVILIILIIALCGVVYALFPEQITAFFERAKGFFSR